MRRGSTTFLFKQFQVQHDRCTMKVGTDAVLLGTWARIPPDAKNILDIGSGSGVISLILAQRTSNTTTTIDAVEIAEEDAQQASENIANSPWPTKIQVHNKAIQAFEIGTRYDMIISNPPYFINSQPPPDSKRLQTRHTTTLNFDALLDAVVRLLKPTGTFHVVLPHTEGLQFIDLARTYKLYLVRRWTFRARKEKLVERLLLEFSKVDVSTVEEDEIILYEQGEEWSKKYRVLTHDFYLK
jgi:tRNA1Val (adenine37-N6)-methyltransferase